MQNILIIDQDIYLCVQDLETIGFEAHYDCFKIKLENKYFVCNLKNVCIETLGHVVDGINGQYINF